MDFDTGKVVQTPGIQERVHAAAVQVALTRHMNCDWGELHEEDARMNDDVLESGELDKGHGRLFSTYRDANGTKFCIITEGAGEYRVTTILLTSEY